MEESERHAVILPVKWGLGYTLLGKQMRFQGAFLALSDHSLTGFAHHRLTSRPTPNVFFVAPRDQSSVTPCPAEPRCLRISSKVPLPVEDVFFDRGWDAEAAELVAAFYST
jgi:hypothetical protein